MKGVVFAFKPSDPVPSWLLDIEPRQDVPGGLSRIIERPLFCVAGQVIDEGPCYAIQCDFKPGDRRVIVGDLYYCHIVVEKPLRWPNGDVWHGMGGPCPEAGWSPDPERVRQAGRNTDALRDLGRTARPPVGRIILTPDAAAPDAPVAARTFWKAGFLMLFGAVIGAVVPAAIRAVLS